ncbi:MAG: PilT/PilU family type 4a pilus ATPase [Candidatus Gastranaerophilales bacterium]|nr:PilT/PilU family type 4a pilus ATPase [Candidatus Gastranaerophilales bacterium]
MAFNIDEFLTKAQKAGASDIHLNCGKVPALRIKGDMYKIASDPIEPADIKTVLEKTLPDEFKKTMMNAKDIDYLYVLEGVSRYRINYAKDLNGGKFTFRSIPFKIKNLNDLSLPPYLEEFTNCNNGIVLISGATGSGKSTTLAALLELINQRYKYHIVTIEDPVEFVYEDKKSVFTQRSLGLDVEDFKSGIKYALRQDPDVILVGEIRDKETLVTAVEASETGHLVFATVHTNGTVASINRLKGFIEDSGQDQFMKRLSACIRGVIHQQLVPTTDDGKLTPAIEILTFTSTVIDYVKEGKLYDITNLMKKSRQPNITTMNMALFSLYQKGMITKETAMEYSLERVEMEQMLRGMYRDNTALTESIL